MTAPSDPGSGPQFPAGPPGVLGPPPGALGGVVTVTRTGGFAGLTMSGTVDIDRLDEPQQAEWRTALGERLSAIAPEHSSQPDTFTYRVTNSDAGVDLTVGDHELPDDLRALLNSALGSSPPEPGTGG